MPHPAYSLFFIVRKSSYYGESRYQLLNISISAQHAGEKNISTFAVPDISR